MSGGSVPSMQPEAQQPERRTFGRYETLFRIAGGGMAEVYAARTLGEGGFQKLVALKRMLPHLADDERFVSMFLDEGRLAANINSPYVVQTLDLGRVSDGSLYIVMELVRGVSLAKLLHNVRRDKEHVPLGVAVELLAQAAQGLHDAHEAKTPLGEPLLLVHRDVSPQNVLVGSDGRARITDFGVARAVQRRTQTATGELKGKFSYFAPEQITSDELDHRVDVFAMGIVAWEAIAGRRLFAGDNPLQQLDRVRSMPIPSVRSLREDVPEELSGVVAAALERDRDVRVQTCGELSRLLREVASRHMTLPSNAEVAAFVRERAGRALEGLEANIKQAFSEAPLTPVGLSDAGDANEPQSHSGVVQGTWGGDLSPGTVRLDTGMVQQLTLEDATRMAVSSAAGSRTLPPPPPPAKGSKLPLVLGVLVGVFGLGVAGWVLMERAGAEPSAADGAEAAEARGASAEVAADPPAEPKAEPKAAPLLEPVPEEPERAEELADEGSEAAARAETRARPRKSGRVSRKRDTRDLAARAAAAARTAPTPTEDPHTAPPTTRTEEPARTEAAPPPPSPTPRARKRSEPEPEEQKPTKTRRSTGPGLRGLDSFDNDLK